VKRFIPIPAVLALALAACGGAASVSSPSSGPITASASVNTGSAAASKPAAASTKPAASTSAAAPASAKPAASGAASAKPAASASAGPVVGNLFSVQAMEYSFAAPDSIPGGMTTIRLTDNGKEPHEVQLVKLNSGVTADQFQTALRNPNPAELLKVAVGTGGVPAVDPGGTAEAVMDLQAGQYYLICFLPGPDGMPHFLHGMVKALTVNAPAASASAAASPQAAASITMSDFTFDMPSSLPAGTTIVKVTNNGPQLHQMAVAKLAPGKTVQDVSQFFASQPAGPPPSGASGAPAAASASAKPAASGAAASGAARPEAGASGGPQAAAGPPPFEDMGGMNGLSKGESGWAVLNLTPGNWVALCAIPDQSGSLKPHVDLGMIKAFTVQ